MKTIFCTHVQDHLFESIGGRKLQSSLSYFYPDIELRIYGTKEIDRVRRENPWCDFYTIHPVVMREVKRDCDLAVHIDADSIITSVLDEILEADYDIAGVRNNSDEFITRGWTCHLSQYDIDYHGLLNAGCVCSTSDEFYEEWEEENKEAKASGLLDKFPLKEQDVYNVIAHSKKYKLKLLDPVGSKLSYGLSNVESRAAMTEKQYPKPKSVPDHQENHWESWMDLELRDGNLYLDDKEVKILHQAGGFWPSKLNFDLFSNKVARHLKNITKKIL